MLFLLALQLLLPFYLPDIDLGCYLYSAVPATRTFTWTPPVSPQPIEIDEVFEPDRDQEWRLTGYYMKVTTPPAAVVVQSQVSTASFKYTAKVTGEYCFAATPVGQYFYTATPRIEGPRAPLLTVTLPIGDTTVTWDWSGPSPDGFRVYASADATLLLSPLLISREISGEIRTTQFHVATPREYSITVTAFTFEGDPPPMVPGVRLVP
jgi:hypothetical protein